MADQDFEKAFSSLAYAEMEQKAPGLAPYAVGFQLVEKNDNDSHALGVFGFMVGQQWYYAPVFWLNGKIKGYELLYIVSQDLFVPMQEAWVNHLTSRQPYVLGEGTAQTSRDLGGSAPDMSVFPRSPMSKQGSSKAAMLAAGVRAMRKIGSSPMKQAPVDVPSMMRKLGPEACKAVFNTMLKHAEFKQAMFTFYSPKQLVDTVNEVTASAKPAPVVEKTAETEHFVSGGKDRVTVIHAGDEDGVSAFTPLTTSEKEKLLRDGMVVRDERPTTADVYKYPKFQQTFQTPNSDGLWRILLFDGSVATALVTSNIQGVGASTKKGSIAGVVLLDKKQITLSVSSDVYAKAKLDNSLWDEEFKGLSPIRGLKKDDVGVLVDEFFGISVPFCVKERTEGDKGDVLLKVRTNESVKLYRKTDDVDTWGSPTPKPGIEYPFVRYDTDQFIHIVKGPARMTGVKSTLLVGDEKTKVLKLGTLNKSIGNSIGLCNFEDKIDRVDLGCPEDVEKYLSKLGMHRLHIKYDGNADVSVKYASADMYTRMPARRAMNYLLEDVGLGEEDASGLLKQARVAGGTTVLVKRALNMGPAPASFDPSYGAPIQHAQQDQQNIPGENNEDAYDPMQDDMGLVSRVRDEAAQAAAMGQKEVFDTRVMMGMVRASRLDDHINNYVKDLIVGNDRIGRLLFLYYWHFDKFTEKFGDEDMLELEDLLRETFKQNGEVILFLKQKSLEPAEIADQSVVDIS